jgi:hypothetical protein
MNRQTGRQAPKDHRETRELVKSAFSLARSPGIKSLVVQADEISDIGLVDQLRDDERVIWVARDRKQMPIVDPTKDVVLPMPDVFLSPSENANLSPRRTCACQGLRADIP